MVNSTKGLGKGGISKSSNWHSNYLCFGISVSGMILAIFISLLVSLKVKKMIRQKRKYVERALSFWIGIGLMSIINIWKISQSQHAVSYSKIMFGGSIIFIITWLILLKMKK